jgi:hypothetical protein
MIAANMETTKFIVTFICLPAATLAAWCVFVVACFQLMSRDLHEAIGVGSTNDMEFRVVPGAPAEAFGLDEPGAEGGLVKQPVFLAKGQLAHPL